MIVEELHDSPSPDRIARALRGRRGFFYLDSARTEGNARPAFSFIGFDPFLTWSAKNETVIVESDGKREEFTQNPLTHLRETMERYRCARTAEIPFCGGAVGYFGYEFGAREQGVRASGRDEPDAPDALFGFHDGVIAIEHSSGKTYAIAQSVAGRSAAEIIAKLRDAVREASDDRLGVRDLERAINSSTVEPVSNLAKEAYLHRVRQVKEYIAAGDVYQVNLSQRFELQIADDPYAIYERLRQFSPAPFGAYLDAGNFQILSSSPELLLRVDEHGRALTRPIKGTRPRGNTPAEDQRLSAELFASEKDHAELLMIVDLERNDLGRVCRYGSIQVEERHRIETHPTVFHLVATVIGQLRENTDVFDCLRSMLPGGSITGAPKIRAMQLIDELEPCRRHVYTGSLGYLGFDGTCDLNIAIRTILCRSGRASYHVGGGIVADSDPEAEYQETLAKGRAMRAALMGEEKNMITADSPYLKYAMCNAAIVETATFKISPLGAGFMSGEGLFETVRVRNSRPVLFEAHHARLAASLRGLDDHPSTSSRGELHTRCMRVIAANDLVNGSLKIIVFKELTGWTELILVRLPAYGPADYERGFQLKTFPGDLRVDPLNSMKSLNYLRNAYARRVAVAAGFNDALFIDPTRQVLEGASSNIFIVKDCVISTPPLGSGILPGVTRAAIIGRLGVRSVQEREVSHDELLEAEEVFVTNALLGVMPVVRVDSTNYDLGKNAITRSVMSAMSAQLV